MTRFVIIRSGKSSQLKKVIQLLEGQGWPALPMAFPGASSQSEVVVNCVTVRFFEGGCLMPSLQTVVRKWGSSLTITSRVKRRCHRNVCICCSAQTDGNSSKL